MESKEERSIINNDKKDSIYSDWSDLIPVNEEVVYGKYIKIRMDLTLLVLLQHWLLLLLKLLRCLLFPQLKKGLRTLC